MKESEQPSNNVEESVAVFKSRSRRWFFPLLIVVELWLITMAVIGIRDDGLLDTGVLILVFCCLFFFITGSMSVFKMSDIVIDDQGIYRVLCGKVWKKICWNNVSKVRIVWLPDYGRLKLTKALIIYPIKKPRRSLLGGKTGLDVETEDAAKLRDVMNQYISKFKIKVEVSSKGKITPTTHI